MAFSLIANIDATGDANNQTSSAIDTTNAKLIIIGLTFYAPVTVTISDSKGNTWIPLTSVGTYNAVRLYYCINPTTNASHTFSYASSYGYPAIQVMAFSCDGTVSFDSEAGASGSNNTDVNPGSITPSLDNALVVAAANPYDGGATFSVDGSFTISNSGAYSAGVNWAYIAAYLIQTSAAAASPTFSYSTASGVGTAAAASFIYTVLGPPAGTVKALVVGGGGAGGYNAGGGGGGGGVRYESALAITYGSHAITIGNGGVGNSGTANTSGSKSKIGTILEVNGGGRGGGYYDEGAGDSGTKATGGGSYWAATPYTADGLGYGYDGGVGSSNLTASGGGGAGGLGGDVEVTPNYAGIGGAGVLCTIDGSSTYYGGGGGGGGYTPGGYYGNVGTDGGGDGGSSANESGTNGTDGLGGGGGGGAAGGGGQGGDGGKGIVIIAYPTGTRRAIGGDVTYTATDTVHTFTSNGTFTIYTPGNFFMFF